MRLNEDQLRQFETEGWLFLPDLFTEEEVGVLKGQLPVIFDMHREEVWREKDTDAVRTAFAAHTYNEAFARLGSHPRLIGPVMKTTGALDSHSSPGALHATCAVSSCESVCAVLPMLVGRWPSQSRT